MKSIWLSPSPAGESDDQLALNAWALVACLRITYCFVTCSYSTLVSPDHICIMTVQWSCASGEGITSASCNVWCSEWHSVFVFPVYMTLAFMPMIWSCDMSLMIIKAPSGLVVIPTGVTISRKLKYEKELHPNQTNLRVSLQCPTEGIGD